MKKQKNETTKKTVKKTSSSNGLVLGAAAALAAFTGYYLLGSKNKKNRDLVKGWTLKAKGEILEKLEKLEDLSEDKYHAVVDSVMAKYKKVKTTTDQETDELEKELKERFGHVARDLKKTQKTLTEKVNKARTELAKKIAPQPAKKTTSSKKTSVKK